MIMTPTNICNNLPHILCVRLHGSIAWCLTGSRAWFHEHMWPALAVLSVVQIMVKPASGIQAPQCTVVADWSNTSVSRSSSTVCTCCTPALLWSRGPHACSLPTHAMPAVQIDQTLGTWCLTARHANVLICSQHHAGQVIHTSLLP